MTDLDKELLEMESLFSGSVDKSLPDRPEGNKNTLFTPSLKDSSLDLDLESEEEEIRLTALMMSAKAENPHTNSQVDIEEKEEEYDEEDIENELRRVMSDSKQIRDLDLTKDLPTVGRTSLKEFVLMKGSYTTLSLEYINDESKVPSGTVPLCIWSEKEQTSLFIRNIQATPDVLYNLRYYLIGIDFSLVIDGEERELDIYHYLGKAPLSEEVTQENDIT